MKKQLIKYFKSLGIEVYTNTKARGHQGFFLRNRIDISKHTKEERIIPTLLHEFSHFIHNKLEPDMVRTGGGLEILFNINSSLYSPSDFHTSIIEKELISITRFVDENSLCLKLHEHKKQVKNKIKIFEAQIKKDYPNFMRSKKFREFDKYIKKTKAKYLLKYDRIKVISTFLRHIEIFSIDNLEHDFPDMPKAFCAYIRLKSAQKKQARISARINRINKYYSKPAELFARLVEGIYIDEARVRALAPHTTKRFFELLEQGYYFELKGVFQLISGFRMETTNLSEKYLFAQS